MYTVNLALILCLSSKVTDSILIPKSSHGLSFLSSIWIFFNIIYNDDHEQLYYRVSHLYIVTGECVSVDIIIGSPPRQSQHS